MPTITSRDNQKIKFVRNVRDGRERDFIFVEGVRLAEEILKSHLSIEEIFFTEDFSNSERGKAFLDTTKNHLQTEVSVKVFDSVADTKNAQGVIAVCRKPATGKEIIEKNLTKKSLVVLLHQINNPTNLGAILRTAEAVAASGIILTKNSADVFSPKAIRGSMGACLRLPIWTNADFFEALDWSSQANLKSVCADVNAEKIYTEIDWKIPRLLVMGSEAHGLVETERAAIDESLLIPMATGVESLNVAVACGIILYEYCRDSHINSSVTDS